MDFPTTHADRPGTGLHLFARRRGSGQAFIRLLQLGLAASLGLHVPSYRSVAQFHWDKPRLRYWNDSLSSDKRHEKIRPERSYRLFRFADH
jgi:hypothetical protein